MKTGRREHRDNILSNSITFFMILNIHNKYYHIMFSFHLKS